MAFRHDLNQSTSFLLPRGRRAPSTVDAITIHVSAELTRGRWLRAAARPNLNHDLEASVAKRQMISIVDDDEQARESTMDLIKSMGFYATAFQCADDFLKSDQLHDTSCLIADMRMPGMSGLDLHLRLVDSGSVVPTILITAFPNDRDRVRALHAGVTCYLTKPFNAEDLSVCVRLALEPDRAN
jgi:CheY-like chemotaxis protein